jgi:hypothetical protein
MSTKETLPPMSDVAMNPISDHARKCAEELARNFGGFEFPNSLLHQLSIIIQHHIDLATAEQLAQNDRLVKALQELMDWQNGPPLLGPKWEPGWNAAMEQSRSALSKAQRGR